MAGLQVLEATFADRGFHVLGFYSNDFGKQGGSDAQIREVTQRYAVTYPQFAIAPVKGPSARPVFEWLLSHQNPGPKTSPMEPSWNFEKWLLSRTGEILAAYGTRDYAGDDRDAPSFRDSPMVQAIEAALAR